MQVTPVSHNEAHISGSMGSKNHDFILYVLLIYTLFGILSLDIFSFEVGNSTINICIRYEFLMNFKWYGLTFTRDGITVWIYPVPKIWREKSFPRICRSGHFFRIFHINLFALSLLYLT